MTDFQKKIINKLLDQFERSQQSWKEEAKSRVVRLNVEKDPLFKNYVHSSTVYIYRKEIDKDVAELEAKMIVVANRDRQTGLLKTIDLKIEYVDRAFLLVKRTPLNDLLDNEKNIVLELLAKHKDSKIITNYLNYILDLINNHKSRKAQYETIEELKINIKIVSLIEKQQEDIFLRVFSKKHFNDSKFVEKRELKLLQIFNSFGDIQYESFTGLLEDHNIVKNKGTAVAKHGLVFKINNQLIDLDDLQEEFYFSMETLLKTEIVEIRKNKIVTIENLTSFYTFEDEDAVILYLGGFHNSAKRELIRKIFDFNNKLSFYHSGDIDCGGFEILIDLRNKTGIDFKPLLMGIDQLAKYINECQPLTENDKKRLTALLGETNAQEFKETIKFMLNHNIKLEQESIE